MIFQAEFLTSVETKNILKKQFQETFRNGFGLTEFQINVWIHQNYLFPNDLLVSSRHQKFATGLSIFIGKANFEPCSILENCIHMCAK